MSPQFTPAIRPFLQTVSIGLVSFGEHYKRNEMGLSESLQGPTCSLPSTLVLPPHRCPGKAARGSLTPLLTPRCDSQLPLHRWPLCH